MARTSRTTSPEVVHQGPVEAHTTRLDSGYTVDYLTFSDVLDMTPILASLPDGRCACPHWGQVQKGRMTVHYDGYDETVEAGDAFHMTPGHVPVFAAGTEVLMFSPTDQVAATEAAIQAAMAGT
jgi:hypothetical protein